MASISASTFPSPSRLTPRGTALVAALLLAAAGCENGDPGGDGETEPLRPAGEEATGDRAPARGTAWVIFDADTVHAEVADTPEAREQGLMYRETLPPGEGMLFVFENTRTRSFWMRNTYVPLDIAFLDSDLEIVDIQQMEPETTDFYESTQPAMFALEVAQGWFGEQEIDVGDRARVVFGPR